jgi:hypothetical protein
MNFPHMPGPLTLLAEGDGSLGACLGCALAFLRSADSFTTRAADASLVGLLPDSGVPTVGGESMGSFCGLGRGSESFVNVGPGGLKGGYWLRVPETAPGAGVSQGQPQLAGVGIDDHPCFRIGCVVVLVSQ